MLTAKNLVQRNFFSLNILSSRISYYKIPKMDDSFIISVRREEWAEVTPITTTQGNLNKNLEKFKAIMAVDRDLSTRSATNAENGIAWLKLEFDKAYAIQRIIIFFKFYTNWYDPTTNWCAESESNFKSCVDGQTNVDVSVYRGEMKQKFCGTLQLTYALEQSDQIYTLICSTNGDSVKFSKTTDQLSLAEVMVIGLGKFL